MAIKLKTSGGAVDLTAPQVVRGIDGGYYIPNVDLDGNLTWHPIRENMPDVPAINIKGNKGDKGDSGVYIGTTPGEDDFVWIDPTDGEVTTIMTRQEVERMLEAVIVPEVDLTPYALKTEIPSTAGLASETYVNNAVNNINGKDKMGNDISAFYVRKIEAEQGKLYVYKGNGSDEEVVVPYLTEAEVKALITAELGVIENGTY